MSAEDRILCEKFLQDPTTNPVTGTRLIKDKGPYNRYVELCQQFRLIQGQHMLPNIGGSTQIPTRIGQVTDNPLPEMRQSTVKSPMRTTVKSSSKPPIKSPTKTTAKSPIKTTVKSSIQTPIKSSTRTTGKSPTITNAKSSTRITGKSPTITNVKSSTRTTVNGPGWTIDKSVNQIPKISLNISATPSSTDKSFTGIPDADLMILVNTNSIEDIVNIYNTSKYFRNLLNQPSSWDVVQKYFELFQLNNFIEVAILKQELEKSKVKKKIYRGNNIYDFKSGDRVVITSKPENYVVVDVKSPNITLQEVDMFGRPSSDELIVGKLQGDKMWRKPWGWYYQEEYELLGIIFGIKNPAGYRIKSLRSPYLKYKTLPSEMQHGKPIEDYVYYSTPYTHAAYLTKLETIPGLLNQNKSLSYIVYKLTQDVPGFQAEPGMLVEVLRKCNDMGCLTNIYYIEAMDYDKLVLKIVPELSPAYGYRQIPDTIIAIKKDDTWYEENTGEHLNLIFGSGNIHNYALP
jgi:hypothetical protein